jgi:hypothetical protein
MGTTRSALIVAHIKGGSLDVPVDLLRRYVQGWPDGDVLISIRPSTRARSLAQNAYYWGSCVQLVAEQTGYTPEEVHDLAKRILLPKALAIVDANGEVVDNVVVGGSTVALGPAAFAEYTDRFREWAADTLGVVIPDPIE